MKLVARTTGNELAKFIRAIEKPIAKAATQTIKLAAQKVKDRSQQQMTGIGFSARSSRNLRYTLDPARGESVDISATFKFRTGYFNVFEKGATIQGAPLLWLPLPNVPLGAGRKQLTPKEYVERVGPLFKVRSRDGKQYLVGARTRAGVVRARADVVKLRKRAVRRGALSQSNVPLYVGVSSVKIPKKLDTAGIVRRVAAQIPNIYHQVVRDNR